jgi:hypothetical protein
MNALPYSPVRVKALAKSVNALTLTSKSLALAYSPVRFKSLAKLVYPGACVATGHVGGWLIAGDLSCDRPVSE